MMALPQHMQSQAKVTTRHWSQTGVRGKWARPLPHQWVRLRAWGFERMTRSAGPTMWRKQRRAVCGAWQAIGTAAILIALPVVRFRSPAEAASPPTVVGTLTGPAEVVFNTQTDACQETDFPDANPRAFRDYAGRVHLISTTAVARAMVGPTLDTVKQDCHVIFRSAADSDPSHFDDQNTLMSFFSLDGRVVAALVHSEFHGWEHPGMCQTPKAGWPLRANCWWNTVTFALSADGGYAFTQPQPPLLLVASLPYRYVIGNRAGVSGYEQPTNILKVGNFYYAMINDWPFKDQAYGPCLIRTTDVLDPKSWRAWNGRAFRVRFVDPYHEPPPTTADHVCQAVLPGAAESLVIDERTGFFVVDQFTPDERFGPPGLYMLASRDLITWSKPRLVISTSDMLMQEEPGKWGYGYFSILDPTSRDRNFSTIKDNAYMYYVRFDQKHPPYDRAVMRRRIGIGING